MKKPQITDKIHQLMYFTQIKKRVRYNAELIPVKLEFLSELSGTHQFVFRENLTMPRIVHSLRIQRG